MTTSPIDNSGLGLSSQTNFPTRVVTTYARDGQTILDGPREFVNVIRHPFRDARALRWSLQLDRRIGKHLTLRTGVCSSFHRSTNRSLPRALGPMAEDL